MYATLVDQAKRGDREAFDSLARLTGDRRMAIAFRILRDFDPRGMDRSSGDRALDG